MNSKKEFQNQTKVLITRSILPEALDYLSDWIDYEIGAVDRNLSHPELLEKIKGKKGLLSLLVDDINKEVIDTAPELKIIANCAVGYNNIDVAYARKKGIMVTNTPGVLTDTTADLTWALLLAAARRIPEADKFVREKRFSGWELDLLLGQEITGKVLGIIGMGRIGKAVAARARGFGMQILYYDPIRLSRQEEKNTVYKEIPEILAAADFITLHTTLNADTYHMISYKEFQIMKKSAVLVNVSRGPVIDEKALAQALEQGDIWGAGLDVFEREPEVEAKLMALHNVVLLPHLGSASYSTRLKMALMAAENLIQALSGEKPPNLVE